MKIAVISGSVRAGRNSAHVTRWVVDGFQALGLDNVEVEPVVLADYRLPVYEDSRLPAMMNGEHDDAAVAAWSAKISEFDAYVLVTPEYNHGVPGALKNATDWLGHEWRSKPIAFVSYGADGGVRAVEQWRQIVANFDMIDIRATVSLGLFTDFGEPGLTPLERRSGELANLANSLVQVTERWNAGVTV